MKEKTRKISEKHIKIIVVIAVIIIVVGLLFWGMIPEKIYEVSEITNSKETFDGKDLNVKGIINNWNISTNNFTLLDTTNENLLIEITHTGAYPEGFGNGETKTRTQAGLVAILDAFQRRPEAALGLSELVMKRLPPIEGYADVAQPRFGELAGSVAVDPRAVGGDDGAETETPGFDQQFQQVLAQQGLAAAEQRDGNVGLRKLSQEAPGLVRRQLLPVARSIG